MPKYSIAITWHYTDYFLVEAETEEDAVELASCGCIEPEYTRSRSDDGDTTVTKEEEGSV